MNVYVSYYLLAAEAYGTGTYQCGEYDEGCVNAATTTGTDAGGTPAAGGLANTGYSVIIPLALAAALILAAGILLVTRVVRKRKAVKA